jgi:hypothetical protein
MDVLCQAKSGMGKTAVFVISTLQQLEPVDGQVSVVVLCHTRELAFQVRPARRPPRRAQPSSWSARDKPAARSQPQPNTASQPAIHSCAQPAAHSSQTLPPTQTASPRTYLPPHFLPTQICHEFERFTTYLKSVRVGNFFGGLPIKQQRDSLKDKDKCPHVIVGTPGRVKGVSRGASGRVEGQGAGQGAAAASGVGGGGGALKPAPAGSGLICELALALSSRPHPRWAFLLA